MIIRNDDLNDYLKRLNDLPKAAQHGKRVVEGNITTDKIT